MKRMTCSGLPANFLRSTGSCVAMPTGQVFRWHLRIMMQPRSDQRRRGEAELLGAEQRGDHDVAAGAHLAVGLQDDAAAQVVLARAPGAFRPGRAPRGRPACLIEVSGDAPVPPSWPRDQDHVGVRLGDAGGDRADARFGDELDADARAAGWPSSGRR